MSDFLLDADKAISAFVLESLSPEYHNNWYNLVPGDKEKGWGATEAVWRNQIADILARFAQLTGSTIAFTQTERRAFRMLGLSTLRVEIARRAGANALPAAQGGLFGGQP